MIGSIARKTNVRNRSQPDIAPHAQTKKARLSSERRAFFVSGAAILPLFGRRHGDPHPLARIAGEAGEHRLDQIGDDGLQIVVA